MTYVIQTILIPRNKFTLSDAQKWVINNGFANKKVDLAKHYFRFRQFDPIPNAKYYTKKIDNDVMLVFQVI